MHGTHRRKRNAIMNKFSVPLLNNICYSCTKICISKFIASLIQSHDISTYVANWCTTTVGRQLYQHEYWDGQESQWLHTARFFCVHTSIACLSHGYVGVVMPITTPTSHGVNMLHQWPRPPMLLHQWPHPYLMLLHQWPCSHLMPMTTPTLYQWPRPHLMLFYQWPPPMTHFAYLSSSWLCR